MRKRSALLICVFALSCAPRYDRTNEPFSVRARLNAEQSSPGAAQAVPATATVIAAGAEGATPGLWVTYRGRLLWPLEAGTHSISSRFGRRWGRFHEGVDLRAPAGTPVYAAHSGTVVISGSPMRSYGRMVAIKGDGLLTVYAHLKQSSVNVGDNIEAGQQVGQVGSSGNARGSCLHFEIRLLNPRGYTAVDPLVLYVDQS